MQIFFLFESIGIFTDWVQWFLTVKDMSYFTFLNQKKFVIKHFNKIIFLSKHSYTNSISISFKVVAKYLHIMFIQCLYTDANKIIVLVKHWK